MVAEKPYDDLILDHIKNARNYRALEAASCRANGSNPLCGDELTVYLKIEGGRIEDVAFQCTCCGISMASGSIMTERVRGKSAADARALLRAFVAALNDPAGSASFAADPALRAVMQTVSKFRSRTRCAALPWVTLEAALDGRLEATLAG